MSTIASAGLVKLFLRACYTWHYVTLRDNQPSRHESSERHLLNANNDPDCQTWICWTYKYTNDRLSNYCGAECMNKESWSVSLQFIHFRPKTPFPSQFSNINITTRHSLPSVAIYCHLLSIYALLSIFISQSWKKVRYRGEMFRYLIVRVDVTSLKSLRLRNLLD